MPTATKTDKKEIELYGGEVEIVFYPNSHRYKLVGERTYLISATRATRHIDKAEALKGWVSKLWRQYLTSKLEEAGEVQYSKAEIELLVDEASRHWVEMQEQAKDVGSEVHDFAEAFTLATLGREKADLEEMLENASPEAKKGIRAFLDWYNNNDVEFVDAELLVYSKQHGYVGITDVLMWYNGKLTIGDYKTSKGLYNDYLYQIAGYWNAKQEEMTHLKDEKEIEQGVIINFNKETGEFEQKMIEPEEYKRNLTAFLGGLEIEKRERELNRAKK